VSTGFLLERFEERDESRAVVAPAGSCSFRELADAVARWRHDLERARLDSGAVVALEGDFSPSAIALFLALAERGAIIVPERAGVPSGGERRSELAQVEARFSVDREDGVHFERTGHVASHALFDELSARGHPGLVQFTSGTLGEPKAAVHDLASLLEKFRVRRPPLSTIAFLLFDHLGGVNTMLHTLSNGATLVCPADRAPATVCELVERHRVELLAATPTFFNLMLLSGLHRRHDLSSLRLVSYGAEPMPQTTLDRLRAELPAGVRFQQTYGMVEVGALRTRSRDDGSLWVKVGGEGFETRVVDGILQIRAQSMILGYLNAEVSMTRDGWLITGDAVERDGEYLRFLGRQSDVINVGGEKVHPAEVEEVIRELEGVDDVVVSGEPNRLMGQVVVAEVTVSEPADASEIARRVKRHCRRRLEPFKAPVRVRVGGGEPVLGDRLKRAPRGALP
jgi:acyl-coenzyme A synthetase/AMP-(fatty) acid ligase